MKLKDAADDLPSWDLTPRQLCDLKLLMNGGFSPLKGFLTETDDDAHPAVNYLHDTAGKVYLGGPITGIQAPVHYDYRGHRNTPNELCTYFRKMGWRRVVAFQPRNLLHRAHQELTFHAARKHRQTC